MIDIINITTNRTTQGYIKQGRVPQLACTSRLKSRGSMATSRTCRREVPEALRSLATQILPRSTILRPSTTMEGKAMVQTPPRTSHFRIKEELSSPQAHLKPHSSRTCI